MGLTLKLSGTPHITARCTGCGACLLTCPERAIRPRAGWARAGAAPLYVLADRCTGCGDCAEVCPADAIEERQMRTIHPIETRSLEILRSRVDLSDLPPLRHAVTERVIHASADLEYATDLVTEEVHLRQGLRALRDGAPIVTDVAMVAAGITARQTICSIGDPAVAEMADEQGLTRSAAAVRLSYVKAGPGAVWVVGCAPTALEEIIECGVGPALVIGLPVGFVGAAESKAALRESGLPAVSNVSEKGGSAVAAAALNALLYAEGEA